MLRHIAIPLSLLLFVSSAAVAEDSLMKAAQEQFKPIPAKATAPKDNEITEAKNELGKMLFFDPRLSSSHLISCNTCHNLGMGGDDNLETSIGHGWAKGPRNAPTVLNAVFNVAQFWDGRAEDLKAQAKGPIQAAVEMNSTPPVVEATLKSMPAYVEAFKKAFPGTPDPVSFDNVAKAIEVFETTLITPSSRFDAYLGGNATAINDTEKAGLKLFMEKGCSACHRGVNVGGHDYFPFGVVEKPGADVLPKGDTGRFTVTKTANDNYVFRSGPLRNIELTAPYFHSGKVWELRDAVAVMGASQLGQKLTDTEIDAITAFLKTLTGHQPKVEYPILPVSAPTTPKPSEMTAK